MIENLRNVMNPPKYPNEIGNLQGWIDVEEKLGIKLPNDYKEFITVYGSGYIGDFLWVLNPFSKDGNLYDDMKHFQWAYSELRKDFPKDYPRLPFPENNSLIIWGATDNGDYLFWVYDKDVEPNNWKVGIYDNDYNQEDIFEMNMSTFLEKLVKNEIETDAFPEDWLEMKNKVFKSLYS